MSRRIAIYEEAPPSDSHLAGWYSQADFIDSYSVRLPTTFEGNMRDVAHAVFGRPEWWVSALISVRNAIVRCFGLQTSNGMLKSVSAAGYIDFFPIISENRDEIVVGEEDRHLTFRISLLIIENEQGRRRIFATTAVRCHNRLGFIYLFCVKPLHRRVICSRLRRAADASLFMPSQSQITA